MISVCMASYNGESYIYKQLESILPQLESNDELIISDDGSSDNTLKIAQSFKDNRIKIFHNNSHDYTRNFENALKHAKGDYIFLCDQDDIWFPNKVEKVMEAFKETNADLVISDARVVDNDMNTITDSYFVTKNVKRGFFRNWSKTSYIGACMAMKKEILSRVIPIPGKSKYIAHDYWIACIGEMYYVTALIDEPLMYYVRHEGTASPGISNQSKLSIVERIYKRFYTLLYLVINKKQF